MRKQGKEYLEGQGSVFLHLSPPTCFVSVTVICDLLLNCIDHCNPAQVCEAGACGGGKIGDCWSDLSEKFQDFPYMAKFILFDEGRTLLDTYFKPYNSNSMQRKSLLLEKY